MSIIQKQRDKYGNDNNFPGNNCIEGTASRTRPFSFEEVMLRRRNKELITYAKEDTGDPGELSEKGHTETAPDHLGPDGDNKLKKDSGRGSSKKKEEILCNKEGGHMKHKDKVRHDLEVNMKVKSGYDKSSRDKEIKKEKQSHHRSRTNERLKTESEKESEKKRPRDANVKDKHGERDRKSQQESKRKHHTASGEKSRPEIDKSTLKKRDFGKWQDLEYSERKGRKYEEPRAKRRRSRSREHDRDRDGRSFSISPRSQKRSYHGQDHGEPSFCSHKDRPGRQYSDSDKYRTSGNGGYESGHYRRRGSGLGGYSPRKRKSEAAVKTPSPTTRSPEKKNATWDLPPSGANHAGSVSMLRSLQSAAASVHGLTSSVSAALTTVKPQLTTSPVAASTVLHTSIDSVQLTQSTRPMRRLYIENLPASATDKSIIEFLNGYLLSSGVNHFQGTLPCISCIMTKEKCQAVVEFLTPEDATMALSFDGRSFSGSILKIRRPKDFVEAATWAPEKPVQVVNTVSDIVKDTPHKIFIGGISKALSTDMLLEIVSAFGLLKAYHFEINQEFNQPCAFLEYADQSVTLKACAGLNGMKLGGNILTVVKALPDIDLEEENTENPPCYDVPDHAKPLLENPTQVLKLKNMFDREEFLLLSEPELDETLEDIRLECARFGSVKSINIVKYSDSCNITTEAIEDDLISESGKVEAREECSITTGAVEKDLIGESRKIEAREEHIESDREQDGDRTSMNDPTEPQDFGEVLENVGTKEDNTKKDLENPPTLDSSAIQEEPHVLDTREDPPSGDTEVAVVKMEEGPGVENGLVAAESKEEHVSMKVEENPLDSNANVVEKCDVTNGDGKQQASSQDVFEPGCVFVEFLREEAACMAAHCLNGRLFGGQVVAAAYIAHDVHQARFPR